MGVLMQEVGQMHKTLDKQNQSLGMSLTHVCGCLPTLESES